MSDYYGNATLEDWLAEEVFGVALVPPSVVSLFEKWRQVVEASIESWMDSDDGDGCSSWRGWGRGFDGIPDEDDAEFDTAIELGLKVLTEDRE